MAEGIDGVIVLDKPAGLSSAKAVNRIKRLFKAKKAGHAGTLDPEATGVLVICLNDASRLTRFFLEGEKRYEAILHLGIETDTQDAWGRVLETRPVPDVSRQDLEKVFDGFRGEILQNPPAFSALKHQGQPLYRLARQGRQIQKPARRRVIHELDIIAVDLPQIRFQVHCQAGTYVRTLCADIGVNLGCGGHMAALRRISSSGFDIGEAVTLETLEARVKASQNNSDTDAIGLISMAEALRGMPLFQAGDGLLTKIRYGRRIDAPDVPEQAIERWPNLEKPAFRDLVRILDARGRLAAVIRWKNQGRTYDYCCVFHKEHQYRNQD